MNNLKKLFCGMLAVLLVVSLAACGGQSTATTAPETTAAPETTEAATEAATEASTEAESYYPVTVTTYDYEGNEITTTYEKAPERVICVYQGTIETMIALGLEDHVIASYGLDNPVKTEWEEGLSKMNLLH